MTTITSSLTQKFQATVPKKIRELLHLSYGDKIAFIIDDAQDIHLRKATPLDMMYAKAIESTLGEWASDYDDESYASL